MMRVETEVQKLRDRVQELEALLGRDRKLTDRVRIAFGIEHDQAEILALIVNRHIATYDAIFTVLYGALPECDQPDSNVMETQVSKLRKALKDHGIKIVTNYDTGWSMSREDKNKIKRTLAALNAALC